jgi:hypothetical protein
LCIEVGETVKHSDFQIGAEFFTPAGKWRCTDAGKRVIVAISLEPRETVRVTYSESGERSEESFISNDAQDLVGPPYSVAEYVFDEYAVQDCYTTIEELPD